MNPRLIAYLRRIGLDREATDEQAWEFYRSLTGMQASVANCLNYNETDNAARTNCDQMLRAINIDPDNPGELLVGSTREPAPAGNDGASTAGDLERNQVDEDSIRQAERDRQSQIRTLADEGSVPAELLARAIDEGWTVDRARENFWQHFRDAHRTTVEPDVPAGNAAPAVHTRNFAPTQNQLVATLMLSQGVDDPTRSWPVMHPDTGQILRLREVRENETELLRAIDQGDLYRGMTIRDICVEALQLDGVRNVQANPQSIMAATRAAPSTVTLVGTFSQVFGAIMLASFQETPDTTQGWTIDRDNPNFFANERTRWEKMTGLTKHGRGQTADLKEISDATEPTKVNRYSGKFVVDEIDLVNDSFGALSSQTPVEMGASAARLRPDLVYSILINNPNMRDGNALFHASHNNLGSAALDKASLQAGLTAIATQKEGEANLNIAGRFVIVPQALRFDTRELLGSATIVLAGDGGGSPVVRPSNNALSAEDLNLVSESRLDNGVTDPDSGTAGAGSDKNWYIASSTANHTIEVTNLRGMARAPELRSYVLGEGQWGIGFDVKRDIGAKALDWRGLYKSVAP